MQRANEMVSVLRRMTCGEMLKMLGLVSLAKKKMRGDLKLPEGERQRSLS